MEDENGAQVGRGQGPSLERCAEPRTGGCSCCCAGLEALRWGREQDPGLGIRVRVLPVSAGGPGLSRFSLAGPQNRSGIGAGIGIAAGRKSRSGMGTDRARRCRSRLDQGCSRYGSGQVPLLPWGAGAVPVPGPAGERRIPGAGAGSRLEAAGARGPPVPAPGALRPRRCLSAAAPRGAPWRTRSGAASAAAPGARSRPGPRGDAEPPQPRYPQGHRAQSGTRTPRPHPRGSRPPRPRGTSGAASPRGGGAAPGRALGPSPALLLLLRLCRVRARGPARARFCSGRSPDTCQVIRYPEWEGTHQEHQAEPLCEGLSWGLNPQPGHFQHPAPTKPSQGETSKS
ncbi:uncharacterized protein LOC129121625 [Agelaius phoeniceus]|uniref:uncharacterized protein LOC129121625 n=1 Tax=Agelaius phoeniceus TaxID=39638 RepID=UPI004054FBB2